MVRRVIDMAGLQVDEIYEAGNGIEALAKLNEHPIDVMLVDINMPTMNGIQLLTRMKENNQLKGIPIVIASTEGSKQRIQQLSEFGAAGYVRKPFQPEQLRDVLEPILGVKANGTDDHETGGDLF